MYWMNLIIKFLWYNIMNKICNLIKKWLDLSHSEPWKKNENTK